MALRQRQSAGFSKHLAKEDRLVIDLETVCLRHVLEQCVADIGPRRLGREIIVDLARHSVSVSVAVGGGIRPDGGRLIKQLGRDSQSGRRSISQCSGGLFKPKKF